jgi:aminoglycoside phosphotransferase (APT) family kinase protein
MRFDHIAEERQENHFTIWVQNLLRKSPEHLSMQLAAKHRAGSPVAARRWFNGAFNVCYRVKYEDGFEAIVRFASLGRTMFRTEKVDNEVAVMEYLAQCTSVPVPQILGKGTCWAGPYIIMNFIEGNLLATYLKDPHKEGRPVLNPRISDRALKRAYREMSFLVLELSKPGFPRIGALGKDESGVWTVNKRPLTFNMNELATSANYPPEEFPAHSFGSATDYFEALATQHLCHLRTQHNDAVTDEADCRKKFVARCLFRKIARDISVEHRHGPFRLYCDDFRPSNIIISETKLCITAAIDWEFAYVAPAEFTYVAPWWLLLQSPEDWESDLAEFLVRYTPRLHLFLEALGECEAEKVKENTLLDSQRLSGRMKQSMENGLFWFCLAARYSSMFDEIYWGFIDRLYYGPFVSIEDRLRLLSEEETSGLDELVRIKMEQAGEATLDAHYSVEDLMDL